MKRLMIGLVAAVLVAAMLPGVASATPGNADVQNFGMCMKSGAYDKGAETHYKINPNTVAPKTVNGNDAQMPNGTPFTSPLARPTFLACS